MNVQRYWMVVLVVFLIVAMILPVVGAAAQGATVVEFKGIETLVEPPVYEGDFSFPGDPKGDPEDPDNPWNPNFHVRNREYLAYEDALNNTEEDEEYNNSCVNGPGHITVNANMNKNGSEYYWGKFIIEPEEYDGTWEMIWRSRSDYIYASGHGTGVFTGMTIKWTIVDSEFVGKIYIPPNAQVQCVE